jgi:two-component system, NtrC family, nitrogen regulation response regulator GlnG
VLPDPTTQTGLAQSTSSVTIDTAPALTILWHPEPRRVGDLFSFADDARDCVVHLSRRTPIFAFHCEKAAPLADPFVSRQPVLDLWARGQYLALTPTAGAPIALDGKPLVTRLVLSPAEIARAPILTIGRRIALCLHFARQPSANRPADLGLLGNSDTMSAVRHAIRSVATLSAPVLIRGETGTGKELTAQAIVANGPRAAKPFVAVNIGALPDNLAAAEIFGHERGSFTGAAQTRDGYFQEANGGTLFLDEIGLARADVQTALLRVLETGEVRRLGSSSSRRVDVRLLAATDSTTIDRAVQGAGFSQALFHRLSTSSIHLPPLRSRREDLGTLLLHFLQGALAQTGDSGKLETPKDAKRPWLSAEIFPVLAAGDWPGNVRQLRNFAMEIAVANRGSELARVPKALLASIGRSDGAAEPALSAPAASKAERIRPAQVLDALERNGFQPSKAARELRVARSTIYEHMRRHPDIGMLADMSDDDFRRHVDDCKGDLRLVAERLRTSFRAVQLRASKTP